MWAVAVHQPERAAQILIKGQIFAQQTYRLDGLVFKLAHRGYRHPVTAQQAAHRGARANRSEKLILRTVEHFVEGPPQKYIVRYNCAAGTGRTALFWPCGVGLERQVFSDFEKRGQQFCASVGEKAEERRSSNFAAGVDTGTNRLQTYGLAYGTETG